MGDNTAKYGNGHSARCLFASRRRRDTGVAWWLTLELGESYVLSAETLHELDSVDDDRPTQDVRDREDVDLLQRRAWQHTRRTSRMSAQRHASAHSATHQRTASRISAQRHASAPRISAQRTASAHNVTHQRTAPRISWLDRLSMMAQSPSRPAPHWGDY